MSRPSAGKPRGLLNPKTGQQKFKLSLHVPASDLRFFVAHYWVVSWDLREQEPYLSENLSHPTVHLVFEKNNTKVFGVVTGRFRQLLQDQGQVFGVKFRPGAFYPFVKQPVSGFTDRTVDAAGVFGPECLALEDELLSIEDEGKMVETAEAFLRERLPERDPNVEAINEVVDTIIADGTILKVDDVVEQLDLNKRGLQRLFSQYVGVSPKWVIMRYRLHEAAEMLAQGEVGDWAALALDLGYFDQAHFIKDFKSIVGQTPAEYARQFV